MGAFVVVIVGAGLCRGGDEFENMDSVGGGGDTEEGGGGVEGHTVDTGGHGAAAKLVEFSS